MFSINFRNIGNGRAFYVISILFILDSIVFIILVPLVFFFFFLWKWDTANVANSRCIFWSSCCLEHTFANRQCTFDDHRCRFAVGGGIVVVWKRRRCAAVRFDFGGRCSVSSGFQRRWQTIVKTVRWCGIGYDATQESTGAAPWKDPVIEGQNELFIIYESPNKLSK